VITIRDATLVLGDKGQGERVFDENEIYKGTDRLCADMVSQKLYPANRYFEVAKKNRLYFNKGDEKRALQIKNIIVSIIERVLLKGY